MAHYTMINKAGKNCGVKALTDAMADRLEAGGWRLIPAAAPVTVITFGRHTS